MAIWEAAFYIQTHWNDRTPAAQQSADEPLLIAIQYYHKISMQFSQALNEQLAAD